MMIRITSITIRILMVTWLLQLGFWSYGQGKMVSYQDGLLGTNESLIGYQSGTFGQLNRELLIDQWMNISNEKKMGYLKVHDQLASDANIYLTYNYELSNANASVGFSMNNSSTFSVRYNHAFSITKWFK